MKMMMILLEKGAAVLQELEKNIQTTKITTIVIESVTNQIEKVVVGNYSDHESSSELIRQELGQIVEDVNEKILKALDKSESFRVNL